MYGIRGMAQLLRAALRVLEVRLLRLAHQEQRHREHCERKDLDRFICERHHAADEAVDDVVRKEPGEPLPEDPPPALVSLERKSEGNEAHVHREVRGAGDETESRNGQPMRGAARDEIADPEDAGGGERW